MPLRVNAACESEMKQKAQCALQQQQQQQQLAARCRKKCCTRFPFRILLLLLSLFCFISLFCLGKKCAHERKEKRKKKTVLDHLF
jgi:hypothetical protein